MKQNSYFNLFQQPFCLFVLTKMEKAAKTAPWAPKLLLGCQNWVKKADGRYNLVPGGHSLHWRPAWSVISYHLHILRSEGVTQKFILHKNVFYNFVL